MDSKNNKRARVSLTLRLVCGYLLKSLLPFLTCIYETLLDLEIYKMRVSSGQPFRNNSPWSHLDGRVLGALPQVEVVVLALALGLPLHTALVRLALKKRNKLPQVAMSLLKRVEQVPRLVVIFVCVCVVLTLDSSCFRSAAPSAALCNGRQSAGDHHQRCSQKKVFAKPADVVVTHHSNTRKREGGVESHRNCFCGSKTNPPSFSYLQAVERQ